MEYYDEQQKREAYLDWFNNYLTLALFAEHREISVKQANKLLNEGRDLHEAYVLDKGEIE